MLFLCYRIAHQLEGLQSVSPSHLALSVTNRFGTSLRRRFEQNQTDCTYTVLALLPTAAENVIEALPVEELTKELQKKRAERLARVGAEGTGSDMSSVSPSLLEDDRKSIDSSAARKRKGPKQTAYALLCHQGRCQRQLHLPR